MVTLEVVDNNNNAASCTQTIIVEDNVGPICITAPYTVQLDDNGVGSIAPTDINDGSTDACGIASISVAPSSFNCANVGQNTMVTLEVVDNNNNAASCTQTIIVEDNVGPICIT
eukprot:177035_1